MNRRNFLYKSAAGTAVAGAGAIGCEKPPEVTGPPKARALDTGNTLAGKSLEELSVQYRYDLDEYKEFQHKYAVDREYGGYTLHTDWDGPAITHEKTAWYEGRGTWSFSFLYNKLDPDPRHIEAARASVDFIMKHKPKTDTFFPKTFTREGKPDAPPDTYLYGDMFIVNGLSEFSKADGNERYWDEAKDIMMKCVRMYDTPGYGANADLPGGARLGGHWFILVRTATQMLEFRSDPDIEAIAARCCEVFHKHHYNPDFDLFVEYINHDYSMPQNKYAQTVVLGHNFEVLWMIMYEAVRTKDKALFDLSAERFKRNFDVAWDDVYGGLFRSMANVDDNIIDVDVKGGWVQMEAMIGLMCIIEHTGAQWAKDYFAKVYTWTMAKFPLKPYGLPLWQDYSNRKAEFVKGDDGRRAENIHHPRHLMLNLLAVERIKERGGAVSDLFSGGTV